jgi:DNA-binding NtrC family response regulator
VNPKKASEMSVLVVDDEEKICELIEIFLDTAFEFRSIVTAPSAKIAQLKMANQEFDVIFIDHNLQGKSGLEFIEQLGQSKKTDMNKVILISGYLSEWNALSAIKHGVRHIMIKPFTREQIVNEVANIIAIKPDASLSAL